MNKNIVIIATLFIAGVAQGQESAINAILQQIEANNKELQANTQLISSQKLENRAENNLPDPTLSYAHLWDSQNSDETVGELVVAQSFDFPTLYATRSKMNRLKSNALDAQATAFRQEVLLQAKEVCLDIIMLHKQQQLLNIRLENAEELSALYKQRLETGDANILEINKLNLELLNVRTEVRMNRSTLGNKLKELQALNGNQMLTAGRPQPDMQTPTAEVLGLTEYPIAVLPEDVRPLIAELITEDAALQLLNSENEVARKQLSASRQGWLPKLELGYRRNTENGHPLNGIVVGFSIPIFENRKKVKAAKAQANSTDYLAENAQTKAYTNLWQLCDEANSLHSSIQEYKQTLGEQQNLTLLKQALEGGELSLIEYFVEASVVYQSQANLIELENQYQKTLSRIYKSRL